MDTSFGRGNFCAVGYLNGIRHYHADACVSTNSELMADLVSDRLAADQAVIYTAAEQVGGRGQYGRSWLSPVGNVYLSYYVPIGQLIRLSGALALCVGLALQQMPLIATINQARQAANLPMIGTKWVNDVGFYDDESALFCKLAGILIEPVVLAHKMAGVVIGVGVNVHVTPTIIDGLYQAISLQDCLFGSILPVQLPTVDVLYECVCQAIAIAIDWHNDYSTGRGGVRLSEDFIAKFNSVHALGAQMVAVYEQNSSTPSHTGICQGIAADGSLLLAQDSKVQAVWAGTAMRVIA